MTATNPTSYTPGPWNDDQQFIVACDPNGIHYDIYIAEIVQEDEEGRLAASEQQQANARLIACAPEMLEELLTLRECCLEAIRGDWNKGNDGFVAMLDGIDAVVSKATGGVDA